MSIRTNPMKAVSTLLKRLVSVEKRADLEDLKSELIKIKNLFSIVKRNEDELLDTLTVVDCYLRNLNIPKLMEEKDDICHRIRISTQKLLPQSDYTQLPQSSKDLNVAVPSTRDWGDMVMSKMDYDSLDEYDKVAFLSLLRFPENAVIKKRKIILWWKQLGLVCDWEGVFRNLRECSFVVPHGQCPVESKFKINPWVRHQSLWSFLQNEQGRLNEIYSQICQGDTFSRSLVLDEVKISDVFGLKSTHLQAVFNVGASYLNFGLQWMTNKKDLEVLQLGRWLHDSPKHHIEVQSEEFLKELRDQKYLKYLSLRGISRIFELLPSILQLESLETLDLKACHNLETLPNDIASLRKLKHLNLSECYLLDRMPKGIDKLTQLEVLKGFVIGSSSKTPCRISDIANLKKLKRLSIHIISGAVIQDREFESLKKLVKLEHIKISWGVSDTRYIDFPIIFPSSLIKLHIEGFPGQNILEWLNKSNEPLLTLEELNISGGKVSSMNHDGNYLELKSIRLKYLKYLDVDPSDLRYYLFPSLRVSKGSVWFFAYWILGTAVSFLGVLNVYLGLGAYHQKNIESYQESHPDGKEKSWNGDTC